METLILTKAPKGKKFIYEIKNEAGEIKAQRISERDYVACTADGSMFFGRRDLIGKGEHGRQLTMYRRGSVNSKESEAYRKSCLAAVKVLENIAYLVE